MLKRFLRSGFFIGFVSLMIATYLRFVRFTSTLIVDPPHIYDRMGKDWPVIFTLWHGQLFLGPIMRYPKRTKTKFLVSRHRDGEMVSRIAQYCGLGVIRGSGSPAKQVVNKGGAVSLREMLRALEEGASIGITADVPKIGFKVGAGVVMLARMSSRSIYPIAMISSRRKIMKKAWDRSFIPLPFGRLVFVVGEPVRVEADADEDLLEQKRRQVEKGLEKATERACSLADKSSKTL